MPADALSRATANALVKPLIRDHLTRIGELPDEELVDLLKPVLDQYHQTAILGNARRKWGIRDIRGTVHFKQLMGRQRNRCAVCGLDVALSGNASLDHIIPFSLIGDTQTGENWRITCDNCNSGKTHWLSAVQSAHAIGWLYRHGRHSVSEPHQETRWVCLALAGRCSVSSCPNGPADGQLYLRRISDSGLWVISNIAVVCEAHLGAMASASPTQLELLARTSTVMRTPRQVM